MLIHSLSNLLMVIISFGLYSFVSLFVYRYCQTLNNRFFEFLSSRRCFIMHICILCVVVLLNVPTNAADEEELKEYKEHMDPLLRELVKDYAFYGLRVK